ncbi:hypothetical protein [Zobellella iuensis]|uniref:DNA polymerase III subunit psi n=1 Tax=Zobellella iuensis TaxID=2803811 RepID=A0ABS1QN11_9GAMM|nr:hypothetical protein [Zobellella iuensis]MBL1375902.1 hypothetical protein [Zobellella iuensis]
MTPLQSQLWQLLELPVWRCAHPERLPQAPAPAAEPAMVLLVVGQGRALPAPLEADLRLALALDPARFRVMDEAAWRAAGSPVAPALLGLNLTVAADAFDWHGRLPLTSTHKRELWSRLCSLCFAP